MKIAEQIKLYTTLWQETNALYEKWAKKHGLSYYELLVILSLADKSACKQKDICQVWQLPKQTVHTILKAFVQHGWVELTPCEAPSDDETFFALLPPAAAPIITITAITITTIGHFFFFI